MRDTERHVHPCEKVIGMFFSESNLIEIIRYQYIVFWYVLKDLLTKLKSANYLSAVIIRDREMKHWKEHDVNFAM